MGAEILNTEDDLRSHMPISTIWFSHRHKRLYNRLNNLGSRRNKRNEQRKGLKKNVRDNNYLIISSSPKKINIDPRLIDNNQSPTNDSNSKSNYFLASPVGIYAGSTFDISPSPRSLPLPSFSTRMIGIDGSATRDLRRLLGLD
ncbi:uncharacterized protein [Spinacia oleracea]|uniref:Uncharacterized protein n=1 Tax=Spinacia oleracea TaxID=3562 RepID=A0ABM3R7H6_SPIOL|nr:uncharacterized protein LOC130467133 [Spinacia oleracea]